MYSVRLFLQMKGDCKRHLLWSVYEIWAILSSFYSHKWLGLKSSGSSQINVSGVVQHCHSKTRVNYRRSSQYHKSIWLSLTSHSINSLTAPSPPLCEDMKFANFVTATVASLGQPMMPPFSLIIVIADKSLISSPI